MAWEYKGGPFRPDPRTDRCKASVHGGGRDPRSRQCRRKEKRDGWCNQHHPDAEEKRLRASEDRWRAKQRAARDSRVACGLREATLDQLREEIARRETK